MEEMGRPQVTTDQRELLIEMFANALRKDAHLRAQTDRPGGAGDVLQTGLDRRRLESSQRYIEGMRDVARVLFLDGYMVADECLEAAYAMAMGIPNTSRDVDQ